MKILRSLFLSCAALTIASSALYAQVTSSGVLTMSGTIDPSISLTFISDVNGVTLTGTGSAAATLALGTISAYGYTPATGITQAVNGSGNSATAFSVSTPFGVLVTVANSASTTYTLAAYLGTADTVNTWTIDTDSVTATSGAITGGTFGTTGSHVLKLSIPFTNTSGTITNVVNVVATST
jgi:hypothetical protein